MANNIERNKEPQNCWEFWDCAKEIKEECPAYKADRGRECWIFASNFCPKRKTDYERCFECPWVRKLNSELYIKL